MTTKARISASVDADLADQAREAVARGDAPNLSAWVDDALRLKLAHDRRLAALQRLVDDFEVEHGVITEDEMASALRNMRARAVVVRGT
jgi:Arc/MetJ-type ribon-helix-helix transcriptional regulator